MTPFHLRQKNIESEHGDVVRLVAINSRYIHSSLALFYLRNSLVKKGVCQDPHLFQATINDNYYETLLRITSDSPRIVLFSANIWNSERIARLVHDIHNSLPRCILVIGGPQASTLRAQLPDDICCVVIGEIEAVSEEFFHDLQTGNVQPEYRGSFLAQRVAHLEYPFRDSDFREHLKNRYIYYETSRGCPHQCSYCQSASEKGLFHKGLEQVETELRDILSHQPKIVRFVDRTFNDVPQRTLAIWKFLASQNCDTLFHFEIAPDRFTEEMFSFLETLESDRFQFEIGIQTTNEQTLQAINRRLDTPRVHQIISRLAHLENIHLHVDLILGLPYESAESFAKSFRDVFAMGAHYIQMGLLKILPETPLSDQVAEYGYKYSNAPPYSIMENRWLNHEQLAQLYWFCECVEKFHNNRYFVSLWSYFRSIGEDIYTFFSGLLRFGYKMALFERAPTQEFLNDLIVQFCKERKDFQIILDLLRYNWLRCGYRRLPASLLVADEAENPEESRDLLFAQMPGELDGVYNGRGRNGFFKRSVFLKLGAQASCILKLGDCNSPQRIAITGERDRSLFRYNRVVLIPPDFN